MAVRDDQDFLRHGLLDFPDIILVCDDPQDVMEIVFVPDIGSLLRIGQRSLYSPRNSIVVVIVQEKNLTGVRVCRF